MSIAIGIRSSALNCGRTKAKRKGAASNHVQLDDPARDCREVAILLMRKGMQVGFSSTISNKREFMELKK
jgi:hypothetical protein